MNPTILIDKSILQGLSNNEIYSLHKYYNVNIPPILVQEILADLVPNDDRKSSKEDQEGTVMELFNRILLGESGINIDYFELISSELKGEPIPMIGKTIRAAEKNEFGILVVETELERKVRKYQQGIFDTQDYEDANDWRSSITEINIAEIRGMSAHNIQGFKENKINSLPALNDLLLEKFQSEQSKQSELLQLVVESFKFSQEEASAVFYRWESHNKPLLSQFCPYALFCTHALMLWHFGTSKGIFGGRTNILDLEYVFYLPFTQVFASNDKFHKSIFPFLKKENQLFITGDELRKRFQLS